MFGIFEWLRRAASDAIVAGCVDGLERVKRGDQVTTLGDQAVGLERLLAPPPSEPPALPAAAPALPAAASTAAAAKRPAGASKAR